MARPGNISSQKITKDVKFRMDQIAKYAPRLRKIIPNFDKLSSKKKSRAATMKSLQELVYPNDPDYSDETIRAEAMGLAVKDYETTCKDSAGRDKYLGKVKKKSPRGYSRGGKVHRGRTAVGNKG